ncbi:BRO-N domain-containing protein [Eubacterium sp.]|uniref:BRO-N domain-containing protein n=1 Tax=Eubacterium sp. TaxID=142586 RepID=UPI002FCC9078
MEKGLMVFNNEKFGDIQTVPINGEPWFVGKDVADILGYANPSKALIDHVDDDDKLHNDSLSSLGQRGGWLINESGLYSLILSSKLPSAKEFKRWVTSEVLPALRKTGEYKSKGIRVSKTPPLSSINMAAKNIMQIYEKAGVDPRYTALAVSEFYKIAPAGPMPSVTLLSMGMPRARKL